MKQDEIEVDPYLGQEPVPGYPLVEKVGTGKIGSVYKAERMSTPPHRLACKIIGEGKLKNGWQKELEKVTLLSDVPNVVQYHSHGGGIDKNSRPYTWVLWNNFVPGINLRTYLEQMPWPLDIAFIENILSVILNVLHACHAVGIQHGDLHEGNILISDPDPRLPGCKRTIWISDFGYGGSHNQLQPKDDYRQTFSIASNLLNKLNTASLNPRDRIMHEKMCDFLKKKILEVDPTQGRYVGNPESLLEEYWTLRQSAERESAAASRGEDLKEPGDYLWAEALGYRVEEWKDLFVPEFLAAQDLLSKNITILTGARGCGKTMAFRRLTAFMDVVIGEPPGVKGADQFVGFYLNCRDLVEAFPWVPFELKKGMQQQIIHYFHLAWFTEVCKTLASTDWDRSNIHAWMDGLLAGIFADRYHQLPVGADVLSHARAFLEDEKERCRLADLGKTEGYTSWPLARVDFLDTLQAQLECHVPWIGQKPLYLFLDDYTIPIVPRVVQRVLNPLIFKRRSKLFFKVSTESANSFEREGLRGKPLELHQDYELIDLATYSLHQDLKSKTQLLDKVFRPRIDRHQAFKGKNLSLHDVLGKMEISNNALAAQMRKSSGKGNRKRILYHGAEAFIGMWSSDIRILIQMFADMLREANGSIRNGATLIGKEIQDKCYRTTGGEFLAFAESVNDPSLEEHGSSPAKKQKHYGKHLHDIAEAFVNTSRHELTKGPLVNNQGRRNPKQAFRIEIIDKFEQPETALKYYYGLVRWHIFFQDWRGKSVRGMITPRLFLNRILIPVSKLTFSSHDSIPLTNKEFTHLLTTPSTFLSYWQKKRPPGGSSRSRQGDLPFKGR